MPDYSTKDLLPAPLLTEVANGPAAFQALRTIIDGRHPTVCTSSTRPTGAALFAGRLIYETDTKAYGWYDGTQWRMWDTAEQSFATTWLANGAGGTAVGSGGSLTMKYVRRGSRCRIDIMLSVGSSGFSGAAGPWTFSAPIACVGARGHLGCKAYAPNAGGTFAGYAYIDAGTSTLIPFLPVSSTSAVLQQAQNANASSTVGTGVPVASGQYTWTTAGDFTIFGEYPI